MPAFPETFEKSLFFFGNLSCYARSDNGGTDYCQKECADIDDKQQFDIADGKKKTCNDRRYQVSGAAGDAYHTAGFRIFLFIKKISHGCAVGWFKKGRKNRTDKYSDAYLIKGSAAVQHAYQDINQSQGGKTVSDHHQETTVISVGKNTGRNAQKQCGQKSQKRNKRRISCASGHLVYIYTEAEACKSAPYC